MAPLEQFNSWTKALGCGFSLVRLLCDNFNSINAIIASKAFFPQFCNPKVTLAKFDIDALWTSWNFFSRMHGALLDIHMYIQKMCLKKISTKSMMSTAIFFDQGLFLSPSMMWASAAWLYEFSSILPVMYRTWKRCTTTYQNFRQKSPTSLVY